MRLFLLMPILPIALGTRIPSAQIKRAEPAPSLTEHDDDIISGQFIVKFKKGTTESVLNDVISNLPGEPDYIYNAVYLGFAKSLNEVEIEYLGKHQQVEYIENNRKASGDGIITQGSATWGLGRISHREPGVKQYVYDSSAGEGTCAYVVDTGVDVTHPDFGGRARQLKSFIPGQTGDGHGHGTHVASMLGSNIYGVAKKTNIYGVKALDDTNSGTTGILIKALDFITKDHQKRECPKGVVVNLSIGTSKSQALNDAAAALVASGVFVAVSAGNGNVLASTRSPASDPSVCVVGATDQQDRPLYYHNTFASNYGERVDIFAPGEYSVSTALGGSVSLTGTSSAVPFVVGLAAYLGALESLSGTKALCDRIRELATRDAIIEQRNDTVNLLAFNGVTDGEKSSPIVRLCANDAFHPPCEDVSAPLKQCVVVPRYLKRKVSSLRPNQAAGNCSFYSRFGCKGGHFEASHPGFDIYREGSEYTRTFNDNIATFRCDKTPPPKDSSSPDRWQWSSQTQRRLCSHFDQLFLEFQLSDNSRAGAYDRIMLDFEGAGAAMHVIIEGPSSGFVASQGIDMKEIFGSDTVELARIRKIRLVDAVVNSVFRGVEWGVAGFRLKARCAGSNIMVELDKFASLNSIQVKSEDEGRPQSNRDYEVWANSVDLEDWVAKPPCSHFETMTVNLEVADKFWAGTNNDIYAEIGKGRFRIAHRPSRKQDFTIDIDLEKAYESSVVPVASIERVSIKSEGGHDQMLPKAITVYARCADSGPIAWYGSEIYRWIANDDQWNLDIVPGNWTRG